MPCDEWMRLADKAKEAKLQRDYLGSTEVTDFSEARRKKRLRKQAQIYVDASRKADEHRHQCPACRIEPRKSTQEGKISA